MLSAANCIKISTNRQKSSAWTLDWWFRWTDPEVLCEANLFFSPLFLLLVFRTPKCIGVYLYWRPIQESENCFLLLWKSIYIARNSPATKSIHILSLKSLVVFSHEKNMHDEFVYLFQCFSLYSQCWHYRNNIRAWVICKHSGFEVSL